MHLYSPSVLTILMCVGVLIDPGSAANFLKLPAFKQMKLSLDVVNLAGQILYGFNGATTVTLGDVALLVKAGAGHLVKLCSRSSKTWGLVTP